MIKEIKITNFYSFSEETIVLQPDVNILIGINGSGKSNFFKAVRLLKEGVAGKGLQKYFLEDLGGFDNILFKGHNNGDKNAIEIAYTFIGEHITSDFTDELIYIITIVRTSSFQNYYIKEKISTTNGKKVYLNFTNGTGNINDHPSNVNIPKLPNNKYTEFNSQELVLSEIGEIVRYPHLTAIKKAIVNIIVYDYFDTTPSSAIRRATLATGGDRLSKDGSNLPQILNTINLKHKSSYRKILEMLKEVNPNFSAFNFHFFGGGNIELMLEEQGLESDVHVSSISDGTLRYLCLMAILYNPERGKFICIDEPETGLHPDMIHGIANAIKYASEQSAIIIATHSVDLLNYFRVENLQVFEKDENNATKVITYKEDQFEGWYDTFNVGQMWVNNDFGGVRYGA